MTLRILQDWWLVTWRYLVRFLREPTSVIFVLLQPIMFVLLFRYVFGGAIKQANYVQYLMPGVVAMSCAFLSMSTGIGLAEDIGSGIIDRLRSMPIARSAVLAGRLIFDFILYSAVVLVIIGTGYAVGFRFKNGFVAALAMMALAVGFGLVLSCVAAFIGMKLRQIETVMSVGVIWLFPMCFVSTAFVPLGTLPGFVQALAKANPVTVVVDTMRALALGGAVAGYATLSLIWLSAIGVVFAPLAVWTYRRAV